MVKRSIGAAVALLVTLAACTQPAAVKQSPSSFPSVSPSPRPDPYRGWKTYHSAWEKATFKYPPTWALKKQTFKTGSASAPVGDSATLTAPDGFTVSWTAPVSGIGGGCDASKAPHIFVDRILRMPSTGSVNPLRMILTSREHRKELDVVDSTTLDNRKTLKVGDTGECLLYPLFRSKFHTDLYLIGFNAGVGGGPASYERNANLTDDQYLQNASVKAALKIFESLRY
jgi:hypothetical protein